MAWIIILMTMNIFYNNSRLKYNEKLINRMNNRKKQQLIYYLKREKTEREKLKNEIRQLNIKHQRAINEYKRNRDIGLIAKKFKLGVREVRLVIKIYAKRGGEIL